MATTAAPRTVLPNLDTLDSAALKTIILAQQEQLFSREQEIEHLKLLLAQLRRMRFGRKSEKLDQRIEQLELQLEELELRKAARAAQAENLFRRVFPRLPPRSGPCGVLCRSICRARPGLISPRRQCVRSAAGSCAGWAKTSPRCWNMYRPGSKSFVTCVPN